MFLDEGGPKCDTVECVESAVKSYLQNEYTDADYDEKVREIGKMMCDGLDNDSALFCVFEAVGTLNDHHSSMHVEFAEEVTGWKLGKALCNACPK